MKQGEQTQLKIIKSASKLFYRRGFHQTAFSDIVDDTGLSKGNITYHFKSKEAILKGVFDRRLENTKNFFQRLDKMYPDARTRVDGFIDSLLDTKTGATRYGCVNGSLAYELGKSDQLNRTLSRQIFDIQREWLSSHLLEMGFTKSRAEEVALEFFTRAQGICVFSQAYDDEAMFEQEVSRLKKLVELD